ncbi:type IV secretory system conjugative DNA transfer family protein [Streptomyces sp. KR80]|uniref:type IV secretory system conjugative DNA transfer family protein n=1 Tax=Streptomyces sp. KR80 TaxID=3457426 RepID=UPI003FD64634
MAAPGSRPSGSSPESAKPGGIPDGLLIGVLAFLLGLTVLVWTATEVSARFARGAWPQGVDFAHTPLAMRQLVEEPHDVAAAWPDAPAGQLSGYGLFWGVFISQLMVLFVVAVFAIGVTARWRARRSRSARPSARGHDDVEAADGDPSPGPSPQAPGARSRTAAAPVDHDSGPRLNPAPDKDLDPGASLGQGTGRGQSACGGMPTPDGGDDRTPAAPLEAVEAGSGSGARGADGAGTAERADGADGAAYPHPDAADRAADPAANSAAASAWLPGQRNTSHLHFTGARSAAHKELAAQAIRAAEGPVLVVTSAPLLWAETKDARAKLGPTHLYDPSHLLDTPARLRWSPSAGCEARDVAAARAAALLAPVRPSHSLDSAMAEAADTLLRCWLHAAAVDGQPFRQVHRWASGSAAHEPVRILRTHPGAAAGTAGELESTLTAYPERREIARQLTARALSALSSIHIRDACNPTRADSLAVESFVAEGGTLYVVGEGIEDPRTHPGAMPLLTALVSSVVEHGRRMAERSSSGRLDPPLTLVLDDIAAVAPLPQLPELLADGAARGLPTLALLRSEEQARARWPHRSLVG